MSNHSNSTSRNIFTVIFTVIGILILYSILTKVFNAIRKAGETKVVSDKGREMLENPAERIKMNAAIENYRQTGEWKDLYNVN